MSEKPSDDTNKGTPRDKFREALERKKKGSQSKKASEQGRLKVKNTNNPTGQRRFLRRKTG